MEDSKISDRKEGILKLKGQNKYLDDLTFPEMLHGATIRSPKACGKIVDISFDGDIPWEEFTIVTAEDIPGKNIVSMIEADWPFLAHDKVNYAGEAVALIAHPCKHLVEKARKYVTIKITEENPILSIDESLSKNKIIWGSDNILKSYTVNKGNVDSIWKKADHIIEETYFTGAQEQLYIENNGMIAIADKDAGNLTVYGSIQCPYYVHQALPPLFNIKPKMVTVIQTDTGGGFGGKEDYPSILAGHAALLSWKSWKPVKMIYERDEDMYVTTKRHPSRTIHKTAVSKEGKILAMEIDFVLDGGAYATLSSVVLSRGTLHATGPYSCDNIKITSRAVATNTPPNGAFRGFGAPQSIFAVEKHINLIANKINIDPIEFRRRNFLKEGNTTATGQTLKEKVDYDKLLDTTLNQIDYYKKIKEYEIQNKKSHIKKGIGISSFFHGAGFTGSGEQYLASVVTVDATANGLIRVLTSSTEIGQGKDTIFSNIVARALNINNDDIEIVRPDTSVVPDSGPTVASRTSMVVGKLVEESALSIKRMLIKSKLLKENYTRSEFIDAIKHYLQEFKVLFASTQYQQPKDIFWDDETYTGDAYPTFAWAVYAAEVSVDTLTYETRVENFIANQEVGNVLHKTLAEGQIEGGVTQGIGFALYEKVIRDEQGKMINNQMTNYIIPTSLDVPNIKVNFEEWNKSYGPGGAKGIGELPMDGPAPAIINAVENALNINNINQIPMLPEDLMIYMRDTNE